MARRPLERPRLANQEALEWHDGAGDELLLLAHATGFCKELWRPVVSSLRDQGVTAAALAWDVRGHGRAPALELPASWWTFGRDLVGLIDSLAGAGRLPESLVGVGHSMGGTVLVLAELLRPGTFTGLVLVEPVLIPPPFVRNPEFSLAQGAARRRPVFGSRDELIESYLAKPLFQRWHPEAFWAYVEHGFEEVAEGLALRCRREVEAELFATGAECGAFARLDELATPVRLVVTDRAGELGPSLALLPEALPNVTTTYMAGQSHLVPVERPDLVAAEIADALQAF
ncbi:MAG: alpha/beta hydrolase [Acidimicrobiia bacterium]|nr:alpha/beta hydrolase [Acidimicrobiia bacterium]